MEEGIMTLQTLARKLKSYEEPLQNPVLKWLYLHLPPQPISSRKVHKAYATAVSVLMREKENGMIDRATSHTIERYLGAIVPFIEEFEKNEYPLEGSTPEEVLGFLMEQNSLSQYDLAKELGGQSVVSDILRGKRKLTREHIERLGKRFHVSPATFYASE